MHSFEQKVTKEDALQVCLTQGCIEPIQSLAKLDIFHQKQHQLIDLESFKHKFDFLLGNEGSVALEKYRSYLKETKKKILNDFSLSMDNLIKANLQPYEEIVTIVGKWQKNDFSQLLAHQQRIQELWYVGIEKNFQQNQPLNQEQLLQFSKIINDMYQIQTQQSKQESDTVFYQFSPKLKHQNMTLVSPTKVRSESGYWKVCAAYPALDPTQGVQKFGFKYVKGQSQCIYFGICHIETIQNKGWKQENLIGGGTYLVGNSGQVYSHCDKHLNGQLKSFQFLQDTPIYCYFQGSKQTLIFKHAITNEQFKLKLKLNGEAIHPCIMMGWKDEISEIIQPFDIPNL